MSEKNEKCLMGDMMALKYWESVDNGDPHPHTQMWDEFEQQQVERIRQDARRCQFVNNCSIVTKTKSKYDRTKGKVKRLRLIIPKKCIINQEFFTQKERRQKPFTLNLETGKLIDSDGKVIG